MSLKEYLGDTRVVVDRGQDGKAGRLCPLPTELIGGDTYMRQQMFHVTSISDRVAHPDIFLTIPCSQERKEMNVLLFLRRTAPDRPDMCSGDFQFKLQALLHMVNNDDMFEKTFACISVIEFQNRGLPHANCIFSATEIWGRCLIILIILTE